MPVFYTKQISGGQAILDEEESRHAVRVLRLQKDDPLDFVDGLGNFYSSVISDPHPAATSLRILDRKKDYLARKFNLHIGIALTKSRERFEWFLEKATEIGIEEITPLICDHSERSNLRYDRSEKILIAAMKQSGRAFLPKLNPVIPFSEFLDQSNADVKCMAHCRAENLPEKPLNQNLSWIVLIGPEGDFSMEEVSCAKERGYLEISLGAAVYRTETAGIMSCQLIEFLNRDK